MRMDKKFAVLIVDDSASVRQALSEIIESDSELRVMATASDPYVAAERIRKEIPDVIILDIEMPRMDGLTFLRKIMAQRPIPVVICSTLTEQGSATMIEALEAGAVDVVNKPRMDTVHFLQESRMPAGPRQSAPPVALCPSMRRRAARKRCAWCLRRCPPSARAS
jgi:two-component system chemotaxis response regulator CheB